MGFVRSETVYWDDSADKLERQGTVLDTEKYKPDVAVFVPKENMTVIFESDKLRKESKLVETYTKVPKFESVIYLTAENIRNLLFEVGFPVGPKAKVSILRGSGSCNAMLVEEKIKIEWES